MFKQSSPLYKGASRPQLLYKTRWLEHFVHCIGILHFRDKRQMMNQQLYITGYPFVLPDMIGGNGYGDDPLDESNIPSKELFVRWLQANVFMPGMQFSFVPWIYDQEVIDYTKAMISLRQEYAEKIVDLAKAAVQTGEPINRPIWWVDPYDETALTVENGKINYYFISKYLNPLSTKMHCRVQHFLSLARLV